MGKIINGYSIDEKLFTGTEFYGELGDLISVVDFENNNVAIIKNQQGKYIYRNAVIDTSVSMSKKGPVVSERIFLGTTERELNDKTIELINNSLEKIGNLDLLGNGEINVDLGLQQSGNSVFVATDELLNHLKSCKNMYPELPLNFALDIMPYEKNSSKTM